MSIPLSGTHLIEASAGTGKTHTIVTLFLRLLLEQRLTVNQILVVTFTKAATAELRDRVRKNLHKAVHCFEHGSAPGDDVDLATLLERSRDQASDVEHLSSALRDLDEASVFTIHGFCQRVLEEQAFESGVRFDLELISDLSPMLAELVYDFWAQEVAPVSVAQVNHLGRRKIDFKALLTLCHTAVTWPEIKLVTAPEEAEVASAVRDYCGARRELRLAWSAARDEVKHELLGATGLNRRTYRNDRVLSWLSALDALEEDGPEDLDGWFNGLRHLTPQKLSQGARKGQQPPRHPFFEQCSLLVQAYDRALARLDDWVLLIQARLIEFARRELAERKEALGVQSFDDLLQGLRRALRGKARGRLKKRILQRYRAVLIDEFQDTDPVQYEIFSSIYSGTSFPCYLIGDPKQAIYGFRGADVFAYLRAANSCDDIWTITTNRRSDPSLVAALNSLFSSQARPFLFDEIRYQEVRTPPTASDALRVGDRPQPALVLKLLTRGGRTAENKPLSVAWGDSELPGLVARDISVLLASGATLRGRRVEPRDVAVLTRTNLQALSVQQALRALQIPTVLRGDASVLDQPEATEVAQLLRALSHPNHALAVRTALCTHLMGSTLNDLEHLEQDEAKWESTLELFRAAHELWERRGIVHAITRLMEHDEAPARLLSLVDGERRMTNFRHIMELLRQAEVEMSLGMSGLLSWYDEVRFDQTARQGMAPDTQQIRLESDSFCVTLTTMHKSKGLEYGIVFCPYLWSGNLLFDADKQALKYHDPDEGNRFKLELRPNNERELELAEREARAESLRLCYVALTRAKHQSVVYWGAFYQAKFSALAYLLHQAPAGLGGLEQPVEQRFDSLSDEQMRRELLALSERSQGTIGVQTPADHAAAYSRPRAELGVLSARVARRGLELHFRQSSFSALTRAHEPLSLPASLGLDLDELTDAGTVSSRTPVGTEPPGPDSPIVLSEFPRGTGPGELLHSILEHADFTQGREGLLPLVSRALAEHNLEPTTWTQPVTQALSDVLETPLSSEHPGMQLSGIPASQRMNELEFSMPVGDIGRQTERLVARELADVFDAATRSRARAPWPKGYPERVRALAFPPLLGFLKGYIDLVFEHDGRFFVVDYKSNYLGQSYQDYAAERLPQAMAEHHYFLQYHLYCVALHRYLGLRLSNYEYEQHFGGALYLFMRGMSPDYGPSHGVFFDRPAPSTIDAFSQLLTRDQAA